MFETRLKVTLIAVGVALLVIVGRLAELQIVHGREYRRRAQRVLISRPQSLPFVRGSISDRTGEVLVSDEPCWDLRIDYRVLAADVGARPGAIAREAKRWKRAGLYPSATSDEEIERAFRAELSRMWHEIAARFNSELSPLSVESLRDRAVTICNRITRIRRGVAERRGFDGPVAEERTAHAIVTGLDAQGQIAARDAFKDYPWVHVSPSSQRTFAGDAEPLAHVLGRMGRVDATHVADDPNPDDPFVKYRPDERLGVSGAEYTAEHVLRGRRGQIVRDARGHVVAEELIEAEHGRDVVLTIHADLQRRLYGVLGEAVAATPESSGGAIVVLDVQSREVLALVSYPSYDPNRFSDLYPTLRDDAERLPLLFRAVANRYAPGSLVKPLVCAAGLTSGRIALNTLETCSGYLLEGQRDRWRCWRIHGTQQRKAHGSIDVVEALKGSCNVFMYRLGERLGVDALCDAFDMVGFGRLSGIGLREETKGINPWPHWLMEKKNSPVHPAHARLFAIGQGEVAVTPLQAANLMATYANGRYRPVTLITPAEPTLEWTGLASAPHWAAIRRGMYEVVNNPEGTAYGHARFIHDGYVLCGKTGSATAHPWPTSYRIPYLDEFGQQQVAIVPAGAQNPAIKRFKAEHPGATFDRADVEVASRWPPYPPPTGENHSHAWFAGFLQAVDLNHQPDWAVPARVAFAVLVEFGGSGGRRSGPIAKRLSAEILEVFGPELFVEPVVSQRDRS